MTISVIISVYQTEKPEYFEEALKSVWDDQTRKPEQIVLVEDGPLTEGLYNVVNAWKKKLGDVLYVCQNEKNLGLTKSLNIALDHVSSDLVARMDSDDRSDARRFERQEAYFESHPDVDIIGGALQEFDETHECLNIRQYPQTHEEVKKYIMKACPLAHPSVMMRMKMFREGLRYDERYRMSQDIQLWFDAILKGYRIGNIPEVVLYFRRAGDVFKRRSRVKAKNEFKIYMNGIYRMHGLWTTAYRYPIARYIFRNLPTPIVKWIYGSRLRTKVLK